MVIDSLTINDSLELDVWELKDEECTRLSGRITPNTILELQHLFSIPS